MTRDRQTYFHRKACRRLAFVSVLVPAFFALPVLGQNEPEGPVFGVKQKRPWLSLDPLSGELRFTGTHTRSTIEDKESGTQKATETQFTETLTLSTHGSIIHPNVVEFNLLGTGGLRQRDLELSQNLGSGSNTNDYITGFDISMHILRNQLFNYTVFAQRSETSASQDFGPTLINTTTTYGGILDIRSKVIPTRFQISRTDTTLDDPANLQGYTQSQDSFIGQSQWNITPNSILAASYSYNTVSQKAQIAAPLDFQTQQLTLSHNYNFGAGSKNNFSSTFDYFEQTGDLPNQRTRWEERLTLYHSDSFNTFYRYTLNQNSRDEFDLTSHTFEAGFQHRLFQSLVTHGSAGYMFQEYSGGQRDQELFARVDWDYTKKVPLGTLGLSLSLNFDYRQNEAQTQSIQVIDDPQTFTDPLGIVITRQNVDPGSVVITDAAGIRVFVPGIDYVVNSRTNVLEIRRVLTGAIAANQSVLVDYVIGPQPAVDQTTYGFALGGRYRFEHGPLKGLSIYTRYLFQEQDIRSENPTFFTPDNRRDLLVGANYQTGPFTFTAEQQWNDSSLDAYNTTRFSATYSAMVLPSTSLSLDATYTMIEYPDLQNNVNVLSMMANVNYRLSRTWQVQGLVSYRDQKDDVFGSVQGLEEQLRLQWRYRQTSVMIFLRNVDLDTAGEKSSYQSMEFSVERRF